jgi:predicted RNA-binding protein YlqC (UPF0109 family)
MLREIMEPPSEISISDIVDHTGDKVQRVMSLQREKELAESLAYLASWSDDPAHVVAVCTEESSGRDGLTIRLAVNTGSLGKVIEGFQKMAKLLEKTARKGLHLCANITAYLSDIEQVVKHLKIWMNFFAKRYP